MTARIEPAPPIVPRCLCAYCREHAGLGFRLVSFPASRPAAPPPLPLARIKAEYERDIGAVALASVSEALGL